MAVIVVAHVLAEVAARLATLLVKRSSIAGAEAEAKAAGWWCEWVAHCLVFLNVRQEAPSALPIRQRYIGNYRDATINFV